MTTTVLSMISMALVYTLISFNVYLTYRVLNVLDITCEASVSLGGCAYGLLLLLGINPVAAFLGAVTTGVCCGFITAFFVNQTKIPSVLAGIVTMTAVQGIIFKFYSYGLTIPLLKSAHNPLKILTATDNLVLISVFVTVITGILYKFLTSEYGLELRVAGSGTAVAEALGCKSDSALWTGLAIANGLAGLAGALITQVNGEFDSHMGAGTFIFGLTAVFLGERVYGFRRIGEAIGACFVGCMLERVITEVFASCIGSGAAGVDYQSIVSALLLILLFTKDRARNFTFEQSCD